MGSASNIPLVSTMVHFSYSAWTTRLLVVQPLFLILVPLSVLSENNIVVSSENELQENNNLVIAHSDQVHDLNQLNSSQGIISEWREHESESSSWAGYYGKPVIISNSTPEQEKLILDGHHKNGFNQYVSDLISVYRELPDFRNEWYFNSNVIVRC